MKKLSYLVLIDMIFSSGTTNSISAQVNDEVIQKYLGQLYQKRRS